MAGPAALFAFWDPILASEPTEHPSIEQRLVALIEPALTHMGYELVRVMVMGRERLTVQIMADRADGNQISIEDCELISHQVSAIIDVEDPIPGHWNLEVSSAGIDRPLTRAKDWVRFTGHRARAETRMPIDGRKRFAGVILGADDTAARMRLDDGAEVTLVYADLRTAKLVLTDALIAATAGSAKTN